MLSPWVAAAIGAAAAIGGGILGASAQRAEASKQRDWAADQYARRYQITMSDMRQAGLNPMLAYSQGVGTLPAGAMGNIGDYGGGAAGNIIAQSGIRTASAKQARSQAELAVAAEKKVQAETVTAKQNAVLARMKTEDYQKAGDSVTGRQAVTIGRLGAAGYKAVTKPPERSGKEERIGPPKKKSKSKRGIRWRSRKPGTTFGPGYKAPSFDDALRRMRNR